jgi:membrane-bound metal-dependent hydrolase YbcI (DUF457 family)
MMVFAGHVGLALVFAYLLKLDPLLVLIGAVLPDFDALPSVFGIKFGKTHRKITHSLLIPLLLLFLSNWFPILMPLSVGLLIHLLGDLDHWGAPLLYPLSKKYYSIMPVNHSIKSYDSPIEGVIGWFNKRDLLFWIEWLMLITGLIITYDYWINLIF